MEKWRKVNWTKEGQYTLIDAIQTAGDLLRGTGHSANLNQKKKDFEQIYKQNSLPFTGIIGS